MRRDIEALDPAVAHKCARLIELAAGRGLEVIVTSTLRTSEEQAALYAQGRQGLDEVNAMRCVAGLPSIAGEANRVVTGARVSVHEMGCAFDLAVVSRGRAVWDTGADVNASGLADYEELGLLGESLGLRWGGRFSSRDCVHFEYLAGLSVEQLSAGMRPVDVEEADKNLENKEAVEMENAKAGLRSSEFYLAVLGAVLPVVNSHLGLEIPVGGVLSIAGVVISYILSRTVLKKG